jgi:hypothetical protein
MRKTNKDKYAILFVLTGEYLLSDDDIDEIEPNLVYSSEEMGKCPYTPATFATKKAAKKLFTKKYWLDDADMGFISFDDKEYFLYKKEDKQFFEIVKLNRRKDVQD